jgi:phosphoserine phosphatase RsbU/P
MRAVAADETGGDTYDVIGYQRALTDGSKRLSSDRADHAVLLLADATGHGIGPALSVTEVRAMLRMAVRTGEPLPVMLQHMNAQLSADLRDERLITAWVGELHATDHTLISFSCGQAPLLYYDAVRHLCETREADTFPFGVFDDLEVTMSGPIHMHPGDIFVVISDGMFEAVDPSGQQFGIDRIIEVIVTHHHASATQILTALRQAVTAFTQGLPANDDRTALVIKRTHDG